MSNTEYELLLDVQRKKCYTCNIYGKCNVLNDDVPCNYNPSKEARKMISRSKGFFGYKYNN